MKGKFLLLLIILLVNSKIGTAQTSSEYTDAISKFIAWISNIDKAITKIDDTEKLKRIYRQFGYISEDLDVIVIEKKELARKIEELDLYQSKNYIPIQFLVNDIITDINLFRKRLGYIQTDLSQTDQIDLEEIITAVSVVSSSNQIYSLSDITKFLFGNNNSKEKLKEIVCRSTELSEKLCIEIKSAKVKIKRLLDK